MRLTYTFQGEKGLTNDDYEPNLRCGVLVCFNLGIERRVAMTKQELINAMVAKGYSQTTLSRRNHYVPFLQDHCGCWHQHRFGRSAQSVGPS